MRNKILIISFVFICGCNAMSEKIKLLTNSEYKFWDYDYKGNKNALFFDKDGRFFYYNYSAVGGLRFQFNLDDEIRSNSWQFIGSDSLSLNGYRYRIAQLTEDSLKLTRKPKWNDSISCIKSPNQFYK